MRKKEKSRVTARFLVGKTWMEVFHWSSIREECWDNHRKISRS